MTPYDGTTPHRLFQSFMQFRRMKWLEQSGQSCRPSDLRLLFSIQRGQQSSEAGLKLSEISQTLHVSAPTVTQLVSTLETRGLVERKMDEDDKRVIRVRLTSAGEAVTDEARRKTHAWFSGLVDHLGEEKSEELVELLSKVLAYADRGDEA